MRKLFLVVFISLNCLICFSQGINRVWAMGFGYGFGGYGINLDFSSGSVQIDTVPRHMNFQETNAQFFDSNKNLLFCSNGIYVANAADDTMQNGYGINSSQYTTIRSIGTASGLYLIQGNLVIPFPDDSTKFYLFHETIDDYGNTNTTFYLYYSVIDMALNGGLGAVVQKNTVLLNDTLIPGGLTACKHANGRDWWLVAHSYTTSLMYKFLITPSVIQVDSQDLQVLRGYSQNVFNLAGDKFATYEPVTDLDLWDFNRCSGMFSNRVHIDIDDSAAVPGVAFSQSGRYLYVSSSGVYSGYVYQFDIMSADIGASKQVVAVRDTGGDFYVSQLAPDNKIYIVGGQHYFHVINYPDSAGSSCGFCKNCIHLPTLNGFTIPNHPNYFLGAESGTACDSLHIDVPDIKSSIQPFNLFPNPAKNVLYITQSGKELIKAINIFNSIGQKQMINYSSIKNGEYLEVNISSLSSGIYFLEVLTEKQKIVKRIMKE